ncbi:TetR/AcrR family transcriptional regulator [Pseudosporangium ferrugineum]|uniref:TetR family transcriptional regulator n=1 Tax=Pseudosporangium ferrugineum TaxID=439699 RepID=A0A2T0SFN4_9ACTN|nr:TetR/AcrR family transcriptional regulator [Pseudosporangium ferrugineum]PRY32229.1 TetR family transcriptional regulator [Pseudosporangium ferrugineum]
MTAPLPQPLRSDARDNRDRILAVARAVFAAEGLDVPLREIARRAGVGPATLYRRFPTKESLVVAAFAEQMGTCGAIVAEGAADPDPWRGFRTVVERLCDLHVRDRGFTVAFLTAYPGAIDFTATRERALTALGGLARRAREAGALRRDFVLEDLVLVLMAVNGIRAPSEAGAVAAARRFAALAIEGFRASGDVTPLPPAVRLPLIPVR